MEKEDNTKALNLHYKNIINSICKEHNLNFEKIVQKYKLFSTNFAKKDSPKIKRKRNKIPDKIRCLGRKQCGEQCTRKRKNNQEFCGSHQKGLPYGRIDDGIDYKPKEKGKRGRKKKNPSLEDLSYNNDYVATWKDPELGDQYLIDSDNIVYTNNPENPRIVGRKNEKGQIEDFDIPPII